MLVMSPLKYPRKVYIGRFDCDNCGTVYTDVEFIADDNIYCKVCDSKELLPLRDVRLKIPLEIKDIEGKTVWVDVDGD